MGDRLKGRVAIVTGGARGIGEGCAKALAAEGARVVIADIKEADAARTVKEIGARGGQAEFVHTDVMDLESIRACVSQVVARHGALHVLVNNAGTNFPHSIDELTPERWDFMLDLNLKSMFLFCKAALPELRKTKGAIVNMSSIRGLIALTDAVAYCASKAGILGFTRGLARDEARTGVRVNAICPSNVKTPLMEEWLAEQANPAAMRKACEDAQPIGRMAEIEEIGRIAVFLASDDSSFMTGAHMLADGGALLD
ncbi:MAG: SDR family oxidoreductase [Planctomycetota bacterium]|nr:SDR family oxidoreductase [Planctomycetota bacterium]